MTKLDVSLLLSMMVLLCACATPIDPPVARAGDDQSDVAVGSVVALDGSLSSDPALVPLEYRWRFDLLPPGSRSELLGSTTATPSFVPDMTGAYRLSLVVSNGVLTSDPDSVDVTAGTCGTNPPVVAELKASPEMPNLGDAVSLSATVTDADMDDPCKLDRTLSYSWTLSKVPPGSQVSLVGAESEEPSFKPDLAGSYQASLTVTDDLGRANAAATLDIVVGTCPSAVTLAANPATPNIGDGVQLEATITDVAADPACGLAAPYDLHWTLAAAPTGSGAALNLPSAQNPSFVVDKAGDYTVRLVAGGANGKQSAAELIITASQCGGNPPSAGPLTASSQAPNIGQMVQLGATVADADTLDPCNLTEAFGYDWAIVAAPIGSQATLNLPAAQNPSFAPDVPGSYSVGLVVSDSTNLASVPVKLDLTVSTCGSAAPTASVEELLPNLAGPGSAVVGPDVAPGWTVHVSGKTSSDADNQNPCNLKQTLSYAWKFQALPAGSNAALNDATIVNPSFQADRAGTYVLELVVTDSTNLKSTAATFTVTADPAVGINVPNGFTIATVATGPLFQSPHGIARDTNGNIYVVQNGSDAIVKVTSGVPSILTSGALLNGPQDIVFNASNNTLYTTAGGNDIVRVSLAGVQQSCASLGGADLRGLELYNGTGGLRLIAADDNNDRLLFLNPSSCSFATSNDFGGNLDRPWGVAAALVGNADNVFATNTGNDQVWRNVGGAYNFNAGTNTRISSSGAINNPRDIVTTPCPTVKLVVANRDGGNLLLFANQLDATPSAIVNGMTRPVGLLFENANNLLVTDETKNALFRITGNFCSL